MFSFGDTTVGHILMTFLISMVPVLELRAAIPAGVIAGLDIKVALLTAVIGNLVPSPFIIDCIREIVKWMQGVDDLRRDPAARNGCMVRRARRRYAGYAAQTCLSCHHSRRFDRRYHCNQPDLRHQCAGVSALSCAFIM